METSKLIGNTGNVSDDPRVEEDFFQDREWLLSLAGLNDFDTWLRPKVDVRYLCSSLLSWLVESWDWFGFVGRDD